VTAPQVPEVDATEAARLVEEGALLLDVREPDEWEAGHAPEASHVPLATLPVNRPPDGRPIVAVCRSGGRSARATAALLTWGYEAVNLAGGMQAWAASGLPIVAGDGISPGQVI
jgi:rhodanese-related sulfurtransferase